MQQIKDVQIPNQYTFNKLQKIFKNKKPTNKSVLLLRLYVERNIDGAEMDILLKVDVKKEKTAKEFVRLKKKSPKPVQNNLYNKVASLNQFNNKRLIDKLQELQEENT